MNGLPRLLQLGDHLCQFFATADELREVLVPYFKEGLERNEACIWITSSAYDRQRALGDMRSAADSFEKRHAAGQLKILADDEWYLTNGRLKTDDLVARWLREKDMALAAGYAGLRLSGNISFLKDRDWARILWLTNARSPKRFAASRSRRCAAIAKLNATPTRRSRSWIAMRSPCEGVAVIGTYSACTTNKRTLRGMCRAWSFAGSSRTVSPSTCAQSLTASMSTGRECYSSRKAHDLGLIGHELVINASKFGAFSVSDGKLKVRWRVVSNGTRRLFVEWLESDVGNPLTLDRPGLGAFLIAETVENCRRVFKPAGMAWTFELALD